MGTIRCEVTGELVWDGKYAKTKDKDLNILRHMTGLDGDRRKNTEEALRRAKIELDDGFEDTKVDYSKNKVNFEHGVPSNSKVIVTQMNHLIEIQYMKQMNHKQTIKMLPRNEETGFREYEVIATGEIHNMNESEKRSENLNSLGQTFKKLRYLINNNFVGGKNELHVTLTYALVDGQPMRDSIKLYKDFEKFKKRLSYKYKDKAKIEYINVVEPQGSGAWHCHCLLRFDGLENVYLKNDELAEMWGHGFVTIKGLSKVDNIGAYLSAYLSDIDVTDTDITGEGVVTREVDGKTKKFLKGGRLHFYDSGMNLYRASRGMKKPVRETMKYKDIKKIVGSTKPHYSQRIDIEKDDYKNQITYIQYNLKRD